jgi:hypothetical protein
MRDELKLMIQRKTMLRKGGEQAEAKAEKILHAVEQRGGLTPDELMILQVY